ncbi:hypothetical protein EON66_07145, partial [archaeon]
MQARELKSVYVDARGSFLKLIIHKCYINPQNLFNQVGLIAINAIGRSSADLAMPGPAPTHYDPYKAAAAAPVMSAPAPARAYGAPEPSPAMAPPSVAAARRGVNDLALDMGFDPETAALLREVAQRKDAAVATEDFEQAKRLKLLQDAIKAVGGRLSELVAEKTRAIEDEDYDRAAQLKVDITRIRAGLNEKMAEAGLRAPVPSSQIPRGAPASGSGGAPRFAAAPTPAPAPWASPDMSSPPEDDDRPIRPSAAAQAEM